MLSPLTTSLVIAGIAVVLVAIAFGVARLWWPTVVARRVAVAFVGGAGLAAIGTTVALAAWSFRMSSSVGGDTYVIFPIHHLRYWIGAAGLVGGLLLAWLAARGRR